MQFKFDIKFVLSYNLILIHVKRLTKFNIKIDCYRTASLNNHSLFDYRFSTRILRSFEKRYNFQLIISKRRIYFITHHKIYEFDSTK